MAFFINPASKLERAFRAYMIIQGAGTLTNSYTSWTSIERVLPNRTYRVSGYTPNRPQRPEGICHLQIIHYFDASLQPGTTDTDDRRVQQDEFFGESLDAIQVGDPQSLNVLADAVTEAGRDLAFSDGTPAGDLRSANNADMLYFRCDWVKAQAQLITRGQANDNGTVWAEEINLDCFVSHANVSLETPNPPGNVIIQGLANQGGNYEPNGNATGFPREIFIQDDGAGNIVRIWAKLSGNGTNTGWA